jgi:catechol-2,3-dioxygenase
MHIMELRLHAHDLDAQRRFFGQTFGISPVSASPQYLSFQIGHTRLTFEHAPAGSGIYHYALHLPEHQFDDAVAWLSARSPLLQNRAGQHRFFFEQWNAHAVYFADGDGNLGELIARHDQPSTRSAPFSGEALLGVNEIGLVVDEVPATVAKLHQACGITPYQDASNPEFTAVGDMDGLFIVVKQGRPWLPTGQPAEPRWFVATVQTEAGLHTLTSEALG